MRQIIEINEIYYNNSLDLILKYCIDENIYETKEIKNILKTKYPTIVKGINPNDELLTINETSRDLSYYEEGQF